MATFRIGSYPNAAAMRAGGDPAGVTSRQAAPSHTNVEASSVKPPSEDPPNTTMLARARSNTMEPWLRGPGFGVAATGSQLAPFHSHVCVSAVGLDVSAPPYITTRSCASSYAINCP